MLHRFILKITKFHLLLKGILAQLSQTFGDPLYQIGLKISSKVNKVRPLFLSVGFYLILRGDLQCSNTGINFILEYIH